MENIFVLCTCDYDGIDIKSLLGVFNHLEDAVLYVDSMPKHLKHHFQYYEVCEFNGSRYISTTWLHTRDDWEEQLTMYNKSLVHCKNYVVDEYVCYLVERFENSLP